MLFLCLLGEPETGDIVLSWDAVDSYLLSPLVSDKLARGFSFYSVNTTTWSYFLVWLRSKNIQRLDPVTKKRILKRRDLFDLYKSREATNWVELSEHRPCCLDMNNKLTTVDAILSNNTVAIRPQRSDSWAEDTTL